MTQPPITLFTKPSCPYCARAKAVLQQAGLDYEEHNVKANERTADASVSFSGVSTVPQVFIGDYHINGAEDLEQLHQSQRLSQLLDSINGASLPLNSISDYDLHKRAEDMMLRSVIPQSDGSRTDDPEAWPILRFYKQFFGFWPNTFAYLHHWPEAYKLFVYCHNFSAVGAAKKSLGDLSMYASGYSTSNAHGCSYCQVHSAATGGGESLEVVKQLKQAREGQANENNPFGPLELAIADLAAEATRNQVTPTTINKIRDLSDDSHQTQSNLVGVEMIAAAFGFLNVFNDLMGLEIEGEWAQQAREQAGIEAGRHGSESSNPSNLDYDLPQGSPTIEEMLAKYDAAVEDVQAHAEQALGLLPAWMQAWPQPLVKRHAYFYCEIMGNRDHTLIPSELKHLMARVSAIAKDHTYLAAVEGFMAHYIATNKDRAVERVRHCFAAATGRANDDSLFNPEEKAALQFAWVSSQMPLTTPRHFVQPALEYYDSKALVHLSVTCAMASMLQRFVAIAKPEVEPRVTKFLQVHGLEDNTLTLRYPLPLL